MRRVLEQQLEELDAAAVPLPDPAEAATWLPEAATRIREWVEQAEGNDLELLLQATQAEVRATVDDVEITGFVPRLPDDDGPDSLITIERTSA